MRRLTKSKAKENRLVPKSTPSWKDFCSSPLKMFNRREWKCLFTGTALPKGYSWVQILVK